MASDQYPLKNVRLEQLHAAGFNVADFICFPPHTLFNREHELQELRAFLTKHKRISCRHFHDDETKYFKCPVKYDQTDYKAIWDFCLANNEGKNEAQVAFYTLCNEAINTQESLCAGNILVLNDQTFFVEYFEGPGTPRDIETKSHDQLKTFSRTMGEPAEGTRPPDEVLRMAHEARKFKPLDNKPYILEFSLYPYPIGRQQTNIICWEWRWGWLHYQLQMNQHLLASLKKASDREAQLLAENASLRVQLGDMQNDHRQLQDDLIATGKLSETFGV